MNFEFVEHKDMVVLQKDSLGGNSEVYVIKDEDDEVIIIDDEEEKSTSELLKNKELTLETYCDAETSRDSELQDVDDDCQILEIHDSPENNDESLSSQSSSKCNLDNIGKKNKSDEHDKKNEISKSDENRSFSLNINRLRYMCNVCDFQCLQITELMVHAGSHNSYKYSCTNCDFKCEDEIDFRRHEIKHATSELFACIKCNFQCNQSFSLQVHMNVVHDKPLQCDICVFTCRNIDEWKSHMEEFGEVTCQFCSVKCHTSEIQTHVKTEHSKTIPPSEKTYVYEQSSKTAEIKIIQPKPILAAPSDEMYILPDDTPPMFQQNILPNSLNTAAIIKNSDSFDSPIAVQSITPVINSQPFIINVTPNFNNPMNTLPNNLNQNIPLYIDSQNIFYGMSNNNNNNPNPEQFYYVLPDTTVNQTVNNQKNILSSGNEQISDQESEHVTISSNSQLCNAASPKISVKRNLESPREVTVTPKRKPEPASKSMRHNKKSQTSASSRCNVIKTLNDNSVKDTLKPVASKDTIEQTLKNCTSDSIKNNGKPNYQNAFADFIQHGLEKF